LACLPQACPLKAANRTRVPATGVLATGGKPDTLAKFGKGGPTIFDNAFFYIKSNELDLKMFIHDRWAIDPPLGIGKVHKQFENDYPLYYRGESGGSCPFNAGFKSLDDLACSNHPWVD